MTPSAAPAPVSVPCAAAASEAHPGAVLRPYPPGTRLPTQWDCWLESACAHLHPAERLVDIGAAGSERATLQKFATATSWRAPLVAQGNFGALTLPGTLETGEPADLAWHDASQAPALARTLARQRRPLNLPRVPLGSPSVQALSTAFRGRGWVRVRQAHGSPCIELDAGWTKPWQKFNAGRQSDFRRAQRRAEEAGALQFEVHAPSPGAGLEHMLDEAYQVESRSWKGDGGTALAMDPLLGPFYRRLAHNASQAGLLRLCFLRIAGQAAAMQLALQGGGRFWLMKIGYDPAFARSSPGQLLMLHTIGHAASQGLASYEMLGNAAAWTAGWTRTLRPFVAVQAYPASWPGARALCADAWRAARARWQARAGSRPGQETPA